jgi:hypothetical protein
MRLKDNNVSKVIINNLPKYLDHFIIMRKLSDNYVNRKNILSKSIFIRNTDKNRLKFCEIFLSNKFLCIFIQMLKFTRKETDEIIRVV